MFWRGGRVQSCVRPVAAVHMTAGLDGMHGYGEWSPSYLSDAAKAIDAWFLRVQKHCTRALFSHGIPTNALRRKTRAA
jgi:hypothetical protein